MSATTAARPIDSMLMTHAGYAALERELHELRTTARQELAERLRDARGAGGDLAENGELMDALRESAELEERIVAIEQRLAAARIAPPAPADGSATVGSRVRLRRRGAGVVEYDLVGAGEADPGAGRISVDSPLGRALAGRRAGERVEVAAPRRRMTFDLVRVEAAEDEAAIAVAA